MARKINNEEKKAQTFSITAPAAQAVQLVGDFTDWQKHPIKLRKEKNGVWRATVKLTPGEHYYRYLVDGEWRDDATAKQTVPNPFGGHNAVVNVHILERL